MPDLNGYWEGKLTSLTYQTTMDMKLEVKQQWSKINFYATFPEMCIRDCLYRGKWENTKPGKEVPDRRGNY